MTEDQPGDGDPFLMIVPLLAELSRAGVVVETDGAGGLVVHGEVDADLGERILACASLLVWEVTGRGSGHAWMACDWCARASMTLAHRPPSQEWPRCRMTPHCPGRHRPGDSPSTTAATAAIAAGITPLPRPKRRARSRS